MAGTETFDYVIVGAGSAGCVLAARLSEDAGVRVLLLEAGEADDADEIAIPAAFSSLFKTRWDWNYETVEQKQLDGRRAYWPRMKALGGCSSMNAMIYIRGNRLDYDGWRDEYGASGWGYEEVLPYFVRAESNTRFGQPLHGTSGPLHVEDRRFTHELTRSWVDSAVAWGWKRTDDFNGAEQEGAGLYQVTCKNGRRWSVADGYLRPALDRPNLTVRTDAQVSAVRFDGTRAIGVSYRKDGQEHTVHAEREIVLSGGAVNSPQLLMLSGVGAAAQLREFGIDVVADLPGVGQNLQDHPIAPMLWYTKGTSDIAEFSTPGRLAQWRLFGRGPLASNIGEGGAFFPSRGGLAAPDLQVHVAPTGFYDNGLREPVGRMFTAGATLLAPASRGSIRLRSADPSWHPEIDANYYDDPSDLDAIVAGTAALLEIARQAPLKDMLDRPFLPASTSGITEAELAEHVRNWTQTLYHPVGTCAMGAGESAVVDPELRVRGVEGLRVVDASVMPTVTRGNTNAPTVMIAEKAADLLLGRPAPKEVA
ncbi:MAG: NAD(P)-binding protein [Actinophytocola sp.]|nr:NAD(P)-binding protein [Actinophytocola sp.]